MERIRVRELAAVLEQGEGPVLLDVRTPYERELARLEPSILIPLQELAERVDEIEHLRGEAVVVYCHHGVRSAYAAEWLESAGFEKVANLEGGIDAWSLQVDPSVPRY